MVRDLALPVEVVGCPIVREADGLALSSRNVRLSEAERGAAVALSRALAAGRAALADGASTGVSVAQAMRAVVAAETLVELDYAAVVDADTLAEVVDVRQDGDRAPLRLLIAARVGPVRLIDNCAAVEEAPRAIPATAGRAAQRETTRVADEARQLERIG
jgi:pantoate--beta-alanine ligase